MCFQMFGEVSQMLGKTEIWIHLNTEFGMMVEEEMEGKENTVGGG